LPDEKQEDFDALFEGWMNYYLCDTKSERIRIQQIAEREWILRRLERILDKAQFDLLCESPNPMEWTDEQHRKLSLLQRYRTAAERAFQSAWKNMEAIRSKRMEEMRLIEQLKSAYYLNRKRGFIDNEEPPFAPVDERDRLPSEKQPQRR
jgi:hypothetical protein